MTVRPFQGEEEGQKQGSPRSKLVSGCWMKSLLELLGVGNEK